VKNKVISCGVVLVLATLMFGCQSVPMTTLADTVFINGKILTVDDEFSIVDAIAIKGDRIVAVGESSDILALAGSATKRIDLEGKTMIPGIIDNHIHYLRGTRFAAHETRIHGLDTRKAVLERIAERAREIEPGEWIFIIGGWNEGQFIDQPGGFTREELDQAAPENPVYMQKTYVAFYMNTLAIDIIAPQVPELYKGGNSIQTSGRDGRKVMFAALEYFPFATSLEGRMEEVLDFNNYLSELGVTTAYDVGYLDGSYTPVAALHEKNALTVRLFHAARYWADSPRTAVAAAEMLEREAPYQRDDFYGTFGIGEHVYGPLHDNTWGNEPFADEIYDTWEMIIREAAKYGWAINEHAMQDSTARRMLEISEEVSKDYPIKDLRWSLGHVDLIEPETVQLAKRLGWNITLANHTLKAPIKGRVSPPVKMIQDSGILWGLGSDGTVVATYNPFHVIWEYTAGKVFPNIKKYESDEVITREQALIAHTRSNAYILSMEDDIGTLEPGKFADLVVLDSDYMTVPIDDIRDIKPVLTMVNGKVVFDAGF